MISPQIPSDMQAEVFLEPAFNFQGLWTKEIKSNWTCAWLGQRTPGLAQISYAEGLKCTPYSYTAKNKEACWAMVGFTLYTDIQHVYREVHKEGVLLLFFACGHVVIGVIQVHTKTFGRQAWVLLFLTLELKDIFTHIKLDVMNCSSNFNISI